MKKQSQNLINHNLRISFVALFVLLILEGFLIIYIYSSIQNLSTEFDKSTLVINGTNVTNTAQLLRAVNELQNNLTQMQKQVEYYQNAATSTYDYTTLVNNTLNSVVLIKTDIAQGSGFFITSDGYIVTNYHVVQGASQIQVITIDNKPHATDLVGYDSNMDVALLKVNGNNYSPLQFDDSNDLKLGERVIAVGDPLGLSFSVTQGIVSGLNRTGNNGLPYYVQTDAPLNPGNSGSPLISIDGKVVGINNFKVMAENIGFALESNYVVNTVNEISQDKLHKLILKTS